MQARTMGTRVLLALALAATVGCAAHRQHTFLMEHAGQHVYSRPLSEVWPEVLGLLQARGFGVQDSGEYVLVTDWREDIASAQGKGSYTRFMVKGTALSPTSGTVHVYRLTSVVKDSGVGRGVGQNAGTWEGEPDRSARLSDTGSDRSKSADQSAPRPKAQCEGGTNCLSTLPTTSGNRSSFELEVDSARGSRDLGLEWELVQRVEPDVASRLQAQASAQ